MNKINTIIISSNTKNGKKYILYILVYNLSLKMLYTNTIS